MLLAKNHRAAGAEIHTICIEYNFSNPAKIKIFALALPMKYYIIIPCHNEAAFLPLTLEALTRQTLPPAKVVLVNDHSTDDTETVIDNYTARHPYMMKVTISSSGERKPGAKVIHAFTKGLEKVDEVYDFLTKLDADCVVPENYFEKIAERFKSDEKIGIAGGIAYEENNKVWKRHHPMDKDHVRGAFKSYTHACFKAIGGLRNSIGWDTADELLARYHGFEIYADETLPVKHLRPTGSAYHKKSKQLQGEAFYKLRYGWTLAFIASLKMALKQANPGFVIANLRGFYAAKKRKTPFIVTPAEGAFIRRYRYQNIGKKLRFNKNFKN